MKYLIRYDAGYGEETKVIEAASQTEADAYAYSEWMDAAENNASYSADELTQELAEDYGFEDELEE